MTSGAFLSHLRSLGVRVWVEGEVLRCNAPKAVLTPELEAEIKRRKSEILVFICEANGPAGVALPLRRVPRDASIPLSFTQQRLWFLDQLDPGNAVYNESFALWLEGRLNIEVLQKTLNALVARHEILRTTFKAVQGVPQQLISDTRSVGLDLIDLQGRSLTEDDCEIQRLLDEEARRPFNLSADLMLRASLLKLSGEKHLLLLVVHHIATDGWSIGVLFQELAALYDAFSLGKPSPLPELAVQYSDFAVWQRQRMQGDLLEKELSYWKKQLGAVPTLLELPTDRPRPPLQTHRGAREPFVLGHGLSEALKELSRREGVTLFMILLAALKVLLHRYTGQNDICVGSPIAGRTQVETEKMIGFFANSLVLCTDLSGNPTFKELLGRVRETALGAYAHQELPFEKLVEELQPKRDMSRNPLFQVMLSFGEVGKERVELAGLSLTPARVDSGTSKFDLFFSLLADAASVKGSLTYNSDLFEAATIRRMLAHFGTLLEGIVADPEQRLSNVPILTEAERHLLVDWNDTKREYAATAIYSELFEAQVKRTPDVLAVIFEDRRLTYSELNARANQLAHHLRRLGVGPDTLVGVFMERSLEMIIGLLGILKAGGAYVPLDPTYPSERLSFMVEDAKLGVLVTQPELIDKLPSHQVRVVTVANDWSQFSVESEQNPSFNATASDLAYVIYTSGSTGKPKGVQIRHGALANFLQSMRERPGMTSQDTLLAVTTLSFDIAGLELHLPLTVGARIVLMPRESAVDPGKLAATIKESGATIMQATPATWRLLLESGWEGNKRLKILCGGEALPRELANQLIEKSASVWNMYGPTETTIWSTVHQVSSTEGPVLVGRPIANTRIYILDRYMQPAPIGVSGELCIGGAGVARGYMNRPELTQEKFIADPFSEEPGARIYRTGDLARYLPDGNIELLGRIDHQVKVRGFRIELGEIEAVLRECPVIKDAVVVAREDVPGDKRLVGYVVAGSGTPPTTGELRSFLQQKLPDYMVPGVFVFLEALPLTPNRKVDRHALPAPDGARPALEAVFVEPESSVEKTLAEIWRGALGLKRVGIHDNFFDLGGHSLLLVQVHSQLQAALGRAVAMIELFRYPTIGTLAKYLSNAPDEDTLKESADRAERRRSAIQQQQQRMQSIARRAVAPHRS